MTPVIVSLTTVPTRLLDPSDTYGIRPGLKTILEQTTKIPHEVHLNIPYSHRGIYTKLPDWLNEWTKKYTHLRVFRCADYGPITKIWPTVLRTTDPETIIITADDDLFYCDGFIDAHLAARKLYPESAIGFAGLSSIEPTGYHFTTSVPENVRVKILEGYKTISYKRKFFDSDAEQFIFSHWNDDIALSAYMGFKNITKMVMSVEGETNFSPRVESFPVIGHTPISGETHGCNVFRRTDEILISSEERSNYWYSQQWLER